MSGRLDADTYFLDMARLAARRSTCLRRAVGCVLINELKHVIGTGYNGVARGLPHCNEVVKGRLLIDRGYGDARPKVYEELRPNACPAHDAPSGTRLDGCGAIHAEQNALLQCPDVMRIDTCYVTHSPCPHCLKLLMNTGCRRIVYATAYPGLETAKTMWEATPGRMLEQHTGSSYN